MALKLYHQSDAMQGDSPDWGRLLDDALAEDCAGNDLASKAAEMEGMPLSFAVNAREKLVLAGASVIDEVAKRIDVSCNLSGQDGMVFQPGETIATLSGDAAKLLQIERSLLNILQHLSAIATMAHAYVEAVEGLDVLIMDTRKTTPGLRVYEKYAVRSGGGVNHRFSLADQVMIKDNHLAQSLSMKQIVQNAKELSDQPIILECDTLAQVKEALDAQADIILLDNMSLNDLKTGVELCKNKALTEASGGITLENVRRVAETGVNRISIGALTHSAGSVDIGMDALDA